MNLAINNCNVYNATGLSGTGCVYVNLANSFTLTNCNFNWAVSTSLIAVSNIIVNGASNSNVFINNNTFMGNDLATAGGYAPTAITCYTPYQVDISNNIFSNIGNGIYITLANAATPKKSINIEKNILSGTLYYL
jgi:polygalacturonase